MYRSFATSVIVDRRTAFPKMYHLFGDLYLPPPQDDLTEAEYSDLRQLEPLLECFRKSRKSESLVACFITIVVKSAKTDILPTDACPQSPPTWDYHQLLKGLIDEDLIESPLLKSQRLLFWPVLDDILNSRHDIRRQPLCHFQRAHVFCNLLRSRRAHDQG